MAANDEIKGSKKEALDELRKRMKGEMDSEMYEDIYLFHRFLTARDFDIDKAETMLRKHIEWRQEYDVKNISNFQKLEVMDKYYPFNFVGYDKEGCVIRYIHSGKLDLKGFHKCCKFEDEIKFLIHEAEEDTKLLKEQTERLSKNVDKCVYIHDFENFSFAQATDKKNLYNTHYFLNMFQNNYPERIKVTYCINIPSFFHMVYSILKPLLAKAMVEKIQLYSDDSFKGDLLKIIDADVLPAFLGGTRTDPDGNPLCLTFINHAGPIPETYYLDKNNKSLAKSPAVRKVKLTRSTSHEVKMDVMKPGSYLEWEFETKYRDIGFGIFYEETVDGEERITEIKKLKRIDIEEYPEKGKLKCGKAGTYVIKFDNTHSWMRTKEVFYRINVLPPEENDTEVD